MSSHNIKTPSPQNNNPNKNQTNNQNASFATSFSPVPLDFNGEIFKSWPKFKLLRNAVNFSACQYDFLLNHSEKIMIQMYKVPIANKIMKWFIYDQFVGGNTLDEVKKTAADLKKFNIEPMLAIPMETEGLTPEMDVTKWQEENLEKMIGSLEFAGQISNSHPPVVHLKVTGIMDNDLFLKLSEHVGFQWNQPESNQKFIQLTDEFYEMMQNPSYDSPIYQQILNDQEYQHLKTVADRYVQLAETSVKNQVECAIDAEYVNINPAISIVTLAMARHVNTATKAYIWNTYQCYLKNTPKIVDFEIKYLQNHQLAWGAKIVRGAYMEKERLRAAEAGYEDPVNPNIQATHDTYNSTVSDLIERMNGGEHLKVLVASHNEDTVKMVFDLREKCKTPENIIFGQLYGMCDHISSELGSKNMPIYKSIGVGG